MNAKIYLTVYLLLFSVSLIFSQTRKLAFIQNNGQWDGDISYRTDFPGGQALATSQGMLVGIFDTLAIQERAHWGNEVEKSETGAQYLLEHPTAPNLRGHGWRFHFLNGNPAPVIVNKFQNSDFYNFWVGEPRNHASKVRSFEEVSYTNVYNNIDVRYYTAPEGNLENDIIIKPFADATNLAFELEGIDHPLQMVNGALVLTTSVGEVSIPAPISYLLDNKGIKTPILVGFTLDNNIIRFAIPAYDHNQTLVIDPIVLRWAAWATNASSADTHNHGTGVDSLGNLYIGGRINSTGLITLGAFQSTAGGGMDLFIGKYTEPTTPGGSGARLWQTYLGGSRDDNCIGLQMGIDGYIYIPAYTPSDISKTYGTGFTAGSWTQRTGSSGAYTQALLVKLDLAGNGALTREIGTTSADFRFNAADLRILKTGVYTYDLVFSGFVTLPKSAGANGDFPTPQTPSGTTYNQPSGSSTKNAIIMRISNDFATLSWIKNIGSDVSIAKDEAVKISTVDLAGNIYVAGYTKATANISYNNPSVQTSLTGTQDGWIMKLNSSGTVQWSRYYNSAASSSTSILSMELNQADTNLIIAGITNGLASLNITAGAAQTIYGGGANDLFVSKISKTGIMTHWGTYFGGSANEDNMMGLNTDLNDDIYFLGYTNSTNYPTASNPIQTNTYGAGSIDAVFTKLSSSGANILYSTYYGGTSEDDDPLGQRGILFNNCRIYLSITANSVNIPLTSGALTTNKTSSTSVPEPVIVSMANPPDLNNTTISSGQTIGCSQQPSPLTAGAATYNIPTITRNEVTQSIGTSGAYPSGVPSLIAYQWQQSIDFTHSWTDILGATGLNYSPPVLYQTTFYRRIVSGDYCTSTNSNVGIIISGGPNVFPSVTCTSTTASFFANPTGGSGSNSYEWSGPLSFASTAENPQILSASTDNNGYYTVTVSDINSCKNTKVIYLNFGSCTYSVILSVSLLHFSVEKTGSTSTLHWQTANEHNSDAFMVQQSADGKVWTNEASIVAAGHSTKILPYQYVDQHPLNGVNYYRLKVNDFDGSYKYSEIKTVVFSTVNAATIIDVVPNPFEHVLTVNYLLPSNGIVVFKVLDAQGRVLITEEEDGLKGANSKQFDTSMVASGLYFIMVSYNHKNTLYQRVAKQ